MPLNSTANPRNPLPASVTCELCEEPLGHYFSAFRVGGGQDPYKWRRTCAACCERAHYSISAADFFANPHETTDWLAHLDTKGWMDWPGFARLFRRLHNDWRQNP